MVTGSRYSTVSAEDRVLGIQLLNMIASEMVRRAGIEPAALGLKA